jgi:hypothetical protein
MPKVKKIYCEQFDDNLIPNYQSFKFLVSSCHQIVHNIFLRTNRQQMISLGLTCDQVKINFPVGFNKKSAKCNNQ